MRTVLQLVKRNFLIFMRDKSAVFFSLLSMIIVILLMAVFLGDMNVNELVSLLEEYGGSRDAALDRKSAEYLIKLWTIAGILVVNSVTITLTAIGVMVQDNEENRLASFYITPAARVQIALGYILSAIAIGTIMCVFTLIVGEGYLLIGGGEMLGWAEHIKALGLIVLNNFVFALMMYLLAILIKSNSAWSGLATIVGTLVGFVGAIYLPMGALPEKIGGILKYLPVLHGTALMREVFTEKAIENIFLGMDKEIIAVYKEEMGIAVEMNGRLAEPQMQVLFLLACGTITLIIAAAILRKRNVADR